jgi:hypothetical protein
MRRISSVLFLVLLVPLIEPVTAQDDRGSTRPTARATRVEEAPRVDGDVLDDPVWKVVPPLTEFWQTSPDAGDPSSERTEVRIVYTGDTIFFGVVCFDSDPSGLTVSDSRRDGSLEDTDSFRILLDTFKDGLNGFIFGTNPAAREYDGQVTNEGTTPNVGGGGGGGGGGNQRSGSGGGFNLNWDGAWQVRTTTSTTGWSAEFAIPFRTLRYSAGATQQWGLNFQRTIRRRKEVAYWARLPIQFDLDRVSLAGTLTGLDVPAQRNLKVTPYVLGESRARGLREGGATLLGDIGGDLKYSLTPSLTLDASVNTDFAQVEVDEQQINLDRFNLFFPEKRPFFLENAGLFAVGSASEAEVFFSRRIGISATGAAIPIVGGARLSGLAGPVNVGILNMQTQEVASQTANNFTVARVRRDLRNRSNIGAIFVSRQATGRLAGDDNHNEAFAADGRLGLGATGLISGYVAKTSTPGRSGSEHAYQVTARNETQPLTASIGYTETGRNFNPEVGFLSRTGGFRKLETQAFSRFRPRNSSWLQELRPHTNFRAFWNHDGFQETGYWHIDNIIELKNSYEFHTGINLTREGIIRPFTIYPGIVVPPGTYDHREAQISVQTNAGAPVYSRTQVNVGGYFGGDRVSVQQNFRVRVGDTLTGELNYTRNAIDLPAGRFTTNLGRLRLSYSFNPRVFVQSLIQYNDRDRVWSSNFRFGWLQEANAGIFVVYTDSHFFEDPLLGPIRPPDRSFIVKISRQFDLLN